METNKMIERSAAIRAVKDYFSCKIERNGMEAFDPVDTSADICRAIESLPVDKEVDEDGED